MRRRRLGRTGFEVSEIGFGGWGIGGTMWRGVPDEEALRALDSALELGVDFFDTALAYGEGHSERLIGRVLRQRGARGRVVVATKVPPRDSVWPGRASTPLAEVFPARWIRRSVEASLGNLGAEVLDVEQLHVWNDAWLDDPAWPDTRAEMERLRDEGKVRHWGISVNDHAPDTALRVLEDPLLETVQVIYNIFDRLAERELFPLARRRGLGVIVRVPFDEGALAGAVAPDTAFPCGDWRHRYFRDDRREEAWRRAEALRAFLGTEAATLSELALRFCLAPPEVSTVIPGMRRPEHVRANAAVSDGRALSADLLEKLRPHAWNKNWYGD